MRIEDSNRTPFNIAKQVNRSENTNGAQCPLSKAAATMTSQAPVSQTERLDQLKQMFSTNQPIDANKLADKMLGTGIFFDTKA